MTKNVNTDNKTIDGSFTNEMWKNVGILSLNPSFMSQSLMQHF